MHEPKVQMSGLEAGNIGATGYENPMTDLEDDDGGEFNTTDENELYDHFNKEP